jgi:hypothetical protein
MRTLIILRCENPAMGEDVRLSTPVVRTTYDEWLAPEPTGGKPEYPRGGALRLASSLVLKRAAEDLPEPLAD